MQVYQRNSFAVIGLVYKKETEVISRDIAIGYCCIVSGPGLNSFVQLNWHLGRDFMVFAYVEKSSNLIYSCNVLICLGLNHNRRISAGSNSVVMLKCALSRIW